MQYHKIFNKNEVILVVLQQKFTQRIENSALIAILVQYTIIAAKSMLVNTLREIFFILTEKIRMYSIYIRYYSVNDIKNYNETHGTVYIFCKEVSHQNKKIIIQNF